MNPHGWDSNPAKTQFGTNPHEQDLNPAKTHGTWFQDLMKVRFLMSLHRKNPVREEVIDKKWIIYRGNTPHRQGVGITEGEFRGLKMWCGELL